MRRESDVLSARVLALHFYVQCWCNQPKENATKDDTKKKIIMHFDFTGTYMTPSQLKTCWFLSLDWRSL